MAIVHLPANWAPATGGTRQLTIRAARVGDVLRALAERYPALEAELGTVAVAVDGEIYNDPEFIDLTDASELHFVPRVAGG